MANTRRTKPYGKTKYDMSMRSLRTLLYGTSTTYLALAVNIEPKGAKKII